jgi:glutamine cyclotransferase
VSAFDLNLTASPVRTRVPLPTATPLPTIPPFTPEATAPAAPAALPTVQSRIPLVSNPATPIERLTYEVLATYPHDPNAWTQGLIYVDGVLFEGTGRNNLSSLRRVELTSGKVEQQVDLAGEFYGEGIALVADRIYQLTWQSQRGFIYNRDSFERVGEFTYPTEGWGLTYDGLHLIMSDGSDQLFFRNPADFSEVRRVQVSAAGVPVARLNELEYVNGVVYANIWQTDTIVRIDPNNGQVLAEIDLTGLLPAEDRAGADVLNGIAYNPQTDTFLVTGKLWPKLFEIKIIPKN